MLTIVVLTWLPLTVSPAATPQRMVQPGDPERGRELFNGRGICYYCHGKDGRRDRLPSLDPETHEIINDLRPRPTDLRDPQALRLKNNAQRFKIIREGHRGTGMFPDTTLSDQEIKDILAYLATLRGE